MAELSGRQDTVSRVASGDLSADVTQYRFLILTGRDVHLAVTTGSIIFGLLQNKPQDNEHAKVAVSGFSKVTLGVSLGVGAFLTTDGSGYAISANSGDYVAGYLTTAAQSGLIGEGFFTFTGSGR